MLTFIIGAMSDPVRRLIEWKQGWMFHARPASLAMGLCILAACSNRPTELGFWLEPLDYTSARIGGPITTAEYAVIDRVARAEIARAFQDFPLRVSDNRAARYTVRVQQRVRLDPIMKGGDVAGASRGIGGFGGSGSVSFDFVANSAMALSPPEAPRAEVLEHVGRGVGRVAIHEFLHQLLPNRPIDGSRDPSTYEGSNPTRADGFSASSNGASPARGWTIG